MMVGIYVLVALVSFFSPSTFYSPQVLAAPIQMGPAYLAVQFQQLNGVTVGSPVLVEGQLVGSVSQIVEVEEKAKSAAFTVQVNINPSHRSLMREGTVGLITSPLAGVRSKPETVIEFLVPSSHSGKLLKEGSAVLGFSSLVEFWSSNSASYILRKKNA